MVNAEKNWETETRNKKTHSSQAPAAAKTKRKYDQEKRRNFCNGFDMVGEAIRLKLREYSNGLIWNVKIMCGRRAYVGTFGLTQSFPEWTRKLTREKCVFFFCNCSNGFVAILLLLLSIPNRGVLWPPLFCSKERLFRSTALKTTSANCLYVDVCVDFAWLARIQGEQQIEENIDSIF